MALSFLGENILQGRIRGGYKMDQLERINRIIQEYDSQGWHRTGTLTDHESADWLLGKVLELGLSAEKESFELPMVVLGDCYLQVADKVIPGLPMYDGSFTSLEGVDGRLGLVGSNADMWVGATRRGQDSLSGADRFGGLQDIQSARLSLNLKGLVAVTVGGSPGLMASNAPKFWDPFGPPVLQVSSEFGDLLQESATRQTESRLVVHVERKDSESFNIVGRIKGLDSTLAPLVVMTPRSGWWHCAGERGGGLACWLEVMRIMSQTESDRDVIFLSTSAHELGMYGIEPFLSKRPGFVKYASNWIHFGANIGASQEPRVRLSATHEYLATYVKSALNTFEVYPEPDVAPQGTIVGGESQAVAAQGGRLVSMVGGNALFHIESDRWPEAIDVTAIARIANSFSDVATRLAKA